MAKDKCVIKDSPANRKETGHVVRKEQFYKLPKPLLGRSDLTSTQKLILAVVTALSNNDEGHAWFSRQWLANALGMTLTATKTALRGLVRDGWINRIPRFKDNIQTTNRWQVNLHKLNESPGGQVSCPARVLPTEKLASYKNTTVESLRSSTGNKKIEEKTGRDVRAVVPSVLSLGSNPQRETTKESAPWGHGAQQVQVSLIGSDLPEQRPLGRGEGMGAYSAPPAPVAVTTTAALAQNRGTNAILGATCPVSELNWKNLLELVEAACKNAGQANGIRIYLRSDRDYQIAEKFLRKLLHYGKGLNDVKGLLQSFLSDPALERISESYTLTAFEKFADNQWQMVSKSRRTAQPAADAFPPRPKLPPCYGYECFKDYTVNAWRVRPCKPPKGHVFDRKVQQWVKPEKAITPVETATDNMVWDEAVNKWVDSSLAIKPNTDPGWRG